MADLSIGSSEGAQTTTQSPQSLVGSGTSTEASSSVQPGTDTSLLTSSSGIPLNVTPLSTVNFGNNQTASTLTTTAATSTTSSKHHINGALLGISIALFAVAVIIFIVITRSAKNTTNYS